jgi:hypothetical protein
MRAQCGCDVHEQRRNAKAHISHKRAYFCKTSQDVLGDFDQLYNFINQVPIIFTIRKKLDLWHELSARNENLNVSTIIRKTSEFERFWLCCMHTGGRTGTAISLSAPRGCESSYKSDILPTKFDSHNTRGKAIFPQTAMITWALSGIETASTVR